MAARTTARGAHAAPPRTGSLGIAGPYVRAQAAGLVLAGAAAAAEVGCQLLAPWPLALAVDHALDGKPLTGPAQVLSGLGPHALLLAAGAALLLLTAVGALLDLGTTVLSTRAAERAGGAMRQDVFEHAVGLSLRWHDRTRSGEVLSRLTTDVGRVQDAVTATFTSLLPDLLLLGGALALMFLVAPGLALLGLVVVPLLAWLSARRRRRVRAAELTAREAAGDLSATATDLLRNVRAVQAFGRRDLAGALFRRPNEAAVRAEVHATTVSARWSPVLDLVLSAGAGLVLVAGGWLVLAGQLTVGGLLVVMSYLTSLHSPVRGLVRLAGVRARASASALRLAEVLCCREAVPEPVRPEPVPPVREGLRLEAVSFAYTPGRPVLRGMDLHVAAGETVCLFGPSGAGKSTVLHLLLRLYDPDAGRVLVDGVDLRHLATVELRRQLAFVPQDPWLLDGTIAENIAFASPDATRADVLAAGRAAWVEEFASALPEGYDTPLGENGVLLSGGQRRRVALARAIVSGAPVVLLDEPTTSLDAASARQVVGAIRSATRDRTVVLVTHDPVLAAIADRTVHVVPQWRDDPQTPLAAEPGPTGAGSRGTDTTAEPGGPSARGEEVTSDVEVPPRLLQAEQQAPPQQPQLQPQP
jgi:ABC-type multidrug transport system fused ATPase/permease subunit